MSAVAVSPERAALIQRLHEALDALERGDETSMRAVIDALASARTRPLVQGLGRLARELSQALGELPRTPDEDGRPVELDDACARLSHNPGMIASFSRALASQASASPGRRCWDLRWASAGRRASAPLSR